MVLLGVISLVPRGSVSANDGAVTYYAQYGRTLHTRAAAEPRNHMVGTADCDSRRAVGPTKTIRRVSMTQLTCLERLAILSALREWSFRLCVITVFDNKKNRFLIPPSLELKAVPRPILVC